MKINVFTWSQMLSSAAEYSDEELQLSRSLITVGGPLLEPSIIS